MTWTCVDCYAPTDCQPCRQCRAWDCGAAYVLEAIQEKERENLLKYPSLRNAWERLLKRRKTEVAVTIEIDVEAQRGDES